MVVAVVVLSKHLCQCPQWLVMAMVIQRMHVVMDLLAVPSSSEFFLSDLVSEGPHCDVSPKNEKKMASDVITGIDCLYRDTKL
jgi:hypothetical protein